MISLIEIHNFLSVGDIKINNIHKMDVVGISGEYEDSPEYSNGSGKSAIVDSIRYSITGKHRYGQNAKEIIRKGQSECYTKLGMIFGKDKLGIKRIIKVGKTGRVSSACEVKLNKKIKATSTREADAFISEYLKINEKDFVNSFFFMQKDFDGFIKDTSGERIKFLEDFFGASIFRDAKKTSSKKRNETNNLLDSVNNLIDAKNESSKEENNIDKLNTEKKKLVSNTTENEVKITILENDNEMKQQEISKMKKNMFQVDIYNEEFSRVDSEIEEITNKGKSTRKDLDKANEANNILSVKILKLQEKNKTEKDSIDKEEWKPEKEIQLNKLRDRKEKHLIDSSGCFARITMIEESKASLMESICPVCDSSIDDRRDQLFAKKEKEVEKLNISMEFEQKEAQDLFNKIDRMLQSKLDYENIEKQNRNTVSELRKSEQMHIMKKEIIKSLDRSRKMYIVDIRKKRNRKKEIEFKLKEIKDPVAEQKIITMEETISKNKIRKANCKNEIRIGNSKIADITVKIEIRRQNKKELDVLTKKKKSYRAEISNRIILEEVYDNCRMEIISIGLEELEEHSNDIIGKIGAIQRQIIFETEKEAVTTGNISNDLGIYLLDNKGKREVKGLSGGEGDSVCFAIRIGLSRYKLMRMDSKIDFVVLDELFGAIDSPSREEMITLINLFNKDFKQTFCISHTDLKECFDRNIKVSMSKSGITTLKKII